MTPITKNGSELIRVFDVHGNELEATYPKRAKGLVRKGRAQWLGSVNHDDPDFVPDSIILYDNADPMPRTADIQQTEVQSMSNNEINNNEYIPEINNTTGIPENAEEIDPAVQKMIEDLSTHITKTSEEIDPAVQKMIEDLSAHITKTSEEIDPAAQKMLEDLAAHITKTSEEIEKKRVEMAKEQEESNIAAAKARMEIEKQRREADEYAGVSFPDFGEIPEIPADAGSVDFHCLFTEILGMLDDIGERELDGDPDIAKIESDYCKVLSENLREVYKQTIAAMEQIRREAAQIAVYNRRQQLLEERIAKLEEDKTGQIKTLGKLFEDGLISADQMIGEMGSTTRFYNDEINKLIAMMN